MYWRGAAALLFVTASYFDTISATLITVTEYPTTCKAVYTSGSQSVTVVQSTVTVSPAPWTDQDANRGMPFVLMVRPHSSMRKERRQPLSVYVMSNGQTTTTMSSAAVCMIENGTLSTMDDGWLSTKPGVTDHPFKFSSTQYPITKWFVVQSGVLHWQNDDFQNSPVKFFEIPADHPNGAQILIEFNPDSNIDSTLEQVDLVTYPYNQQSSGGSSGSSGNQGGSPSTSASASNGGGNQEGNLDSPRPASQAGMAVNHLPPVQVPARLPPVMFLPTASVAETAALVVLDLVSATAAPSTDFAAPEVCTANLAANQLLVSAGPTGPFQPQAWL